MADERIDLSPLDPSDDPERVERVMRAVMARVAASVGRRERGDDVWGALASSFRPAVAAAVVIAAASAAALLVSRAQGRPRGTVAGVTESAGLPRPLADWVDGHASPTAGELVVFLQGYQ